MGRFLAMESSTSWGRLGVEVVDVGCWVGDGSLLAASPTKKAQRANKRAAVLTIVDD